MQKNNPLLPAIDQLKISLDTVKTNSPINRRRGDLAQANLEDSNAKSYRNAITILRGVGYSPRRK